MVVLEKSCREKTLLKPGKETAQERVCVSVYAKWETIHQGSEGQTPQLEGGGVLKIRDGGGGECKRQKESESVCQRVDQAHDARQTWHEFVNLTLC